MNNSNANSEGHHPGRFNMMLEDIIEDINESKIESSEKLQTTIKTNTNMESIIKDMNNMSQNEDTSCSNSVAQVSIITSRIDKIENK